MKPFPFSALALSAFLLAGCRAPDPGPPVNAYTLPPYPPGFPNLRRDAPAAQAPDPALAAVEDEPPAPRPVAILLRWNHARPDADGYRVYESSNLTHWRLLAATSNQTLRVTIADDPGPRFFFVTATNRIGEVPTIRTVAD